MAIYVERFIAEFARRLSVTAILQQSDSKISFTQGEFRPRCSQVDHHRNLCGTDVFKIIYRKIMPAYSKQKTTKFRSSERVHLDRKSTLFFFVVPLHYFYCIIFTNLHVLSMLSLSFIIILLHFETHFWRGGVDNKMAIRRRQLLIQSIPAT